MSIPAPFRSVLTRDGFDGLYCYPALDTAAIDAGGNALMSEIEALISRYPPFSAAREQFALALYGTSETLKIDGEGRVVLSESLEAAFRRYRLGGVCRSRSQVSDLGARPFSQRARGGHPKGARAQERAWLPDGGAWRARSAGMMGGGDGSAVAGGPAPHIPVLGRAAIDFLNVRDGGIYIDGTFGAGGYTRAILAAAGCKVVGIDRDQSAIALGADLVEAAQGRLTLVEDRFSNLDKVARDCGVDAVDGVVLDVGVSSMQLDRAERGFSFRHDGPLDMRMGHDGPSAADVVAAAERA